ncbi:MAG: hypothetical protein BWX85_01184 [Chloroflexi bacterium ADurb.Bin120]|jgi:hypothetical protein|uniref:Uncharacterized protein n=1 Tax=Candidatus Brevifilum fermentans TaxID=1986204 RepID=A0A1Y6K4X8_9CHLR|nr:hypothetical protein [Brevefilum fermentans]OQB83696.1 MAG: hypothetical protein BWX85_01184 [Chloroflexi bacterium ADurb.Bin120]SMX54684.1 exported protein of unknown function [Brevefilum fermentans]HOM67728.1 hypothetical protein [Brevefilum fermentans]
MIKKTKLLYLMTLLIIISARLLSPQMPLFSQPAYGQQKYTYHFPLFLKLDPFSSSSSYYITTLNNPHINNLGCQLGTRDKNTPGAQDNVVILAFGYPRCFNSGGYGANLFGYGPATLSDVSNAVKQFALGYYNCTGSDKKSNLVIGVGTSNFPGVADSCATEEMGRAHGAAWSAMVKGLNQWALDLGMFHQVQIYGANDMEIGWNTPSWSRAWLSGFEQVSGNLMLHFGDAAGCPYDDHPNWSCGTSAYPEWTQEDVWYLSYGAPSALPLPLIYLTNGVHAKQWAHLSRYSVLKHGYRMDFSGVFTQWAYCQQFGWCNKTDNTPDMAHQQLTFELSKSPSTAQTILWTTDIRWIMQNEFSNANEGESMEEIKTHPAQERSDSLAFALLEPGLSPTMRASLAAKQYAYQTIAEMAATSMGRAAPKETLSAQIATDSRQIPFQSGIIERGEMLGLPYGTKLNQVWQSITEGGYLQVGAGAAADNLSQGVLYILLTSPDHTRFESTLIEAPAGCASLSILNESNGFLSIQSANGCQLEFDLANWAWSISP